MHGFATFTIMAYFCEFDVGEIIVPMLLMEVSTCTRIVYNIRFRAPLVTQLHSTQLYLLYIFSYIILYYIYYI
jgi:hypothetical protein